MPPTQIKSNPTQANKLLLALASGRPQPGSNGDGNASGANQEGVGEEAQPNVTPQLGAHPKPTYPPDHQAAMRVPRGGSMCANCKFLAPDGANCTEQNFIRWNGGPQLPAPADQYCSDWYMLNPAPGGENGFRQVARPGVIGGTTKGSQPAGMGSNGPLQAPATTLRSPGSV